MICIIFTYELMFTLKCKVCSMPYSISKEQGQQLFLLLKRWCYFIPVKILYMYLVVQCGRLLKDRKTNAPGPSNIQVEVHLQKLSWQKQ